MLPTLFILDDDCPLDTLAYTYAVKIANYLIEIPQGFQTDYASIPRFLIPFFIKYEEGYKKAAVIHDWLYWEQKLVRKLADKILLMAMEINNTPWHKRYVIYYAVRIFGSLAWKNNKHRKMLEGKNSRIVKVNLPK